MRGIAAVAVLASAVALAVPASSAAAPPGFVRLSDERTSTWSAWVERPGWVRSAPSMTAPKLTLLGTLTYHGSPELVEVLGRVKVAGRSWRYIRYPGLGDRRGWVPGVTVEVARRTDTRLVLDRSHFSLKLMRNAQVLFTTEIGVGAVGSPTPAGHYYIRERLGPFRDTNSIYGALAFGTSAFSPFRTDWPGGGQVGIHGTNQPSLVPGRISNGCVRLRNSAVRRLGRLLRVGTPLLIK